MRANMGSGRARVHSCRKGPTNEARLQPLTQAVSSPSRTTNEMARQAREGHEFTRAVKAQKMKPGLSRRGKP
jgi:hypothetical protein